MRMVPMNAPRTQHVRSIRRFSAKKKTTGRSEDGAALACRLLSGVACCAQHHGDQHLRPAADAAYPWPVGAPPDAAPALLALSGASRVTASVPRRHLALGLPFRDELSGGLIFTAPGGYCAMR